MVLDWKKIEHSSVHIARHDGWEYRVAANVFHSPPGYSVCRYRIGQHMSEGEWFRGRHGHEDRVDLETGKQICEEVAQKGATSQRHELTFRCFSTANRERCESPDGFGKALDHWTLSDWITATVGEFGEMANVAKKLNRVRDGIPGNTHSEAELRQMLADEIADTFIYLDLLAQSAGLELADIVAPKFDQTSQKIGYPVTLDSKQISPLPQPQPGRRDVQADSLLKVVRRFDLGEAAHVTTSEFTEAFDELRSAFSPREIETGKLEETQ